MPNRNDQQYNEYMREVQSYLKQVRNGRRVPASDPTDPRFSQAADDERQAKKAGLGKYIQQGPPAPAFSQVAPPTGPITAQSAAPLPGGLGSQVVDWMDQQRGKLGKMFSSRGAAAPSPVWGFHEPTHTMAEGIAPLAGAAGDVMADPRNAWMGLGPLAAVSRPAGWGAEVLRRYKLQGGTPETLNRTLANRAMSPESRQDIVTNFRKGTDIAAPPTERSPYFAAPQQEAMEQAGDTFDVTGRGAKEYLFKPYGGQFQGSRQPIGLSNILANPHTTNAGMESRTQANAAYDAVSRQAGRVMDSPTYGFRRPSYGPEPLSEQEVRMADRATRRQEASDIISGMERQSRQQRGMAPPSGR